MQRNSKTTLLTIKTNTTMAKSKKSILVVYGTEENFYEGEILGKFETNEQALEYVRECVRDDLKNAGYEGEELDELVEECLCEDVGGDTNCYCDYRYVYMIGEHADEDMEDFRNEQLQEHFPEEFEDEECEEE